VRQRVPDVRGQRLDLAEGRLEAVGLDWEEIGGGAFGVVVRSHWHVCEQQPRPGRLATSVNLVIERECPSTPPWLPVVPEVRWLSLEDAGDQLAELGIGYRAETSDDDVPVVEHLWEVCGQDPAAGTRTSFVELYVARDCD
jgi:beta-lactam-binding protein with PASTA domain